MENSVIPRTGACCIGGAFLLGSDHVVAVTYNKRTVGYFRLDVFQRKLALGEIPLDVQLVLERALTSVSEQDHPYAQDTFNLLEVYSYTTAEQFEAIKVCFGECFAALANKLFPSSTPEVKAAVAAQV